MVSGKGAFTGAALVTLLLLSTGCSDSSQTVAPEVGTTTSFDATSLRVPSTVTVWDVRSGAADEGTTYTLRASGDGSETEIAVESSAIVGAAPAFVPPPFLEGTSGGREGPALTARTVSAYQTEFGLVRRDAIELPPVDGQRLPPVGHAIYIDGHLTTYTHIVLGESGRMLQITQYDDDGTPTQQSTVPYPDRTPATPFSPAASFQGGSQTFQGRVAAFCSKVFATVLPKPLMAKQGDEECIDEDYALTLAYGQLAGASGVMATACLPPVANPVACAAAALLYATAVANLAWRQGQYDDCMMQQTSGGDQPQVSAGEDPLDVDDDCTLWGHYVSWDGGVTWTLMHTYWVCE